MGLACHFHSIIKGFLRHRIVYHISAQGLSRQPKRRSQLPHCHLSRVHVESGAQDRFGDMMKITNQCVVNSSGISNRYSGFRVKVLFKFALYLPSAFFNSYVGDMPLCRSSTGPHWPD